MEHILCSKDSENAIFNRPHVFTDNRVVQLESSVGGWSVAEVALEADSAWRDYLKLES